MLWKGFQRPKRLDFERDTLTERFGRFHAQPFERGFGTTIGNALRRVLLSSIEGAAVTAVKIEGVLHEFSPIIKQIGPGGIRRHGPIGLLVGQGRLTHFTRGSGVLNRPHAESRTEAVRDNTPTVGVLPAQLSERV